MNTQERSPLEQSLLEAARALGAHHVAEITANQKQAIAQTKKDGFAANLKEAEYVLAEADAVHSNAALTALNLTRRLRKLQEGNQGIYDATTATRIRLWALASSSNEDEIIEAARQYGDAARAYWMYAQESKELSAENETAQEALKVASEARKVAVQKRGKAKAELETAEQEYNAVAHRRPESCFMFDLEKAVTNAAHALTGTEDMQFAYSYVYTPDLPIERPGALPQDGGQK